MSDDLNILKELGAQKIHKDTHISKEHVQAILHESFDGLNRVQFVGFISILEREYGIDLSALKTKGLSYFNEESTSSKKEKKVFVVPKRQQSYAKLYILLGALIFISFVYYTFVYLSSVAPEIEKLDNTNIENAKKAIRPVLEIENSEDANETNASVSDENATVLKVETDVKKEESTHTRSLKVLPKNKVWVGYIELATNKKHQNIFTQELAIDASKDWLLLFGAGNIKLEVNGEIQKFESQSNMRFKYVDGELIQITLEEFKSLNRGRKW